MEVVLLIEAKLAEMGLVLPAPMRAPDGFRVTWRQVRVVGTRAIIAGHAPRTEDGTYPGPFGKVGSDLSVEQGYEAARLAALAVLVDLKRELEDLDRVTTWLRVFGMVNSAPGFTAQAQVIDGFTDLMVSLYGEERAVCPRAVAGMAQLAVNVPLIIEAKSRSRPPIARRLVAPDWRTEKCLTDQDHDQHAALVVVFGCRWCSKCEGVHPGHTPRSVGFGQSGDRADGYLQTPKMGGAGPVSYALRRYSRRARRMTSEVVTPSLAARSSAAARRLGSSRTDSTVFAAAPSGGRPRPRRFSPS